MPTGVADKEDEAKLDAALAIAALSNGSWNSNKLQTRQKCTTSEALEERTAALHVVDSLKIPPRLKNSAKRKRPKHDLTEKKNSASPQPKMTVDDIIQGRYVKCARQTSVTDITCQTMPSSKQLSSSSDVNKEPVLASSNNDSLLQANPIGGFFMTDPNSNPFLSAPFQLIPLTQVSPSVPFLGQSDDSQNSTQLIMDPYLMQLLLQPTTVSNLINFSNFCNLNTSPSTVVKVGNDMQQDDVSSTASGSCISQLPGSLSTLRDYYISVSQPPEITADLSSASAGAILVAPRSTFKHKPHETEGHSFESSLLTFSESAESVNGTSSASMLKTDMRCSSQSGKAEEQAASGLSSNCSSVTPCESSVVNMPGSLSSLRTYYSALSQSTDLRQFESPKPNGGFDKACFTTGQSLPEVNISDISLSSNYLQKDQHEIFDIDGHITLAIEGDQTHANTFTRIQTNCDSEKKPLTNLAIRFINGLDKDQCPSSLSGFVSILPVSTSPLRILPKINETSSPISTTSSSSHSPSRRQKCPDLTEINTSSVNLPPKKRKLTSSAASLSQLKLDTCNVLLGKDSVPFKEFISRLNVNDPTYQCIFDQIQSAIVSQSLSSASVTTPGIPVNFLDITSNTHPGLILSNSLNCCPEESLSIRTSSVGTKDERGTNDNVCLTNKGALGKRKISHILTAKAEQNDDIKSSYGNGEKSVPLPLISLSSQQYLHPVLQPDEDGDLPLHIAVAQGKLDIVQHLTSMMSKFNATIDCRNNLRQTPLHLGIVTGDVEVVKHLLGAGASPNIADRKGQNCFHLAVQYRQIECLECLFSCCSESQPDLMNYEGMTPVHLAVRMNLTDALIILLKAGAQPDIVDGKSGHTALYMAANTNRLKAAEILLLFGANAQISSYSSCSPVQAASSKSFHDMVKLLMKHGASEQQLSDRTLDSKDSSEFGSKKGK